MDLVIYTSISDNKSNQVLLVRINCTWHLIRQLHNSVGLSVTTSRQKKVTNLPLTLKWFSLFSSCYQVINLNMGNILSWFSYMHQIYLLGSLFFYINIILLCLTFFVWKFHWSGLNSLPMTSIWSKTIIYSFTLKTCLVLKSLF